jgi:hypothetical protein
LLYHQLNGWTLGNLLGEVIPFRILLRREVRTVKELLETEDLNLFLTGLLDEFEMFLDQVFFNLLLRLISGNIAMYLNQTASYDSWHPAPSSKNHLGILLKAFRGFLKKSQAN